MSPIRIADTGLVELSAPPPRHNRRVMAYSAAAMYGAAAVDGLVEILLPNVPSFSMLPIYVTTGMFLLLMTLGPRLPRRVLAGSAPVGVAMVSYALATTNVTASDASVLYALPVLWQSLFFGRRGAVCSVALVAIGDALALVALGRFGYPERWVDVMVSASAIALVVTALEERNLRLVASLSLEARIDPLTGLLNRRGFDERAGHELGRLRREAEPLALITFDVDHFKRVNDAWGHDVGDRVLTHIGRLLQAHARSVDLLARLGGEEFVVLLPGSDVAGARVYADRVRRALAAHAGGLPAVRLSAGVCEGSAKTELKALVARADSALYEAKRTGRDRTRVFAAGPSAGGGALLARGRAEPARTHRVDHDRARVDVREVAQP